MKIHVLQTGEVRVSPYLPFGGNVSMLKGSGLLTPKKRWIWLPVTCYLIEHPSGLYLVDTGWHCDISPRGTFDKKAETRELGWMLTNINDGVLPLGAAIDEQLAAIGYKPSDIDCVLLTHLDCDHANGLKHVADARRIIASRADMDFAMNGNITHRIRYKSRWWKDVNLELVDWNGEEGPAHHSFDLLDDGSITMINQPGHSDGLCCVRVRNNATGRYIILAGDGGYARKSWREMITSGVVDDKRTQERSLRWLHGEDMKDECIDIPAHTTAM